MAVKKEKKKKKKHKESLLQHRDKALPEKLKSEPLRKDYCVSILSSSGGWYRQK